MSQLQNNDSVRRGPVGGGAMGQKVRDFPWETTSLGAIERWPHALLMAVDGMLSSEFPSCLVWGVDLITIYNNGFLPILGARPEALGRPFSEVWNEVWDAIGPIADKAFGGEATFIEDFQLFIDRHGQLEEAYFTFCYSPIRDESGAVVGILDVVVETTGKVKAERALRDLASSLEKQVSERTADRSRMWQLSTDLMLVMRLDGVITAINPAWTSVLGWTEPELLGQTVVDFIHPDDLAPMRASVASLQTGINSERCDRRYRHKAGRYRTIAWTAVLGDGLINAVGRDITDELEQAQALRVMDDRLRQSQKMESLGNLTGGVAHDFNNVLQIISSNLQLLEHSTTLSASEQRRLRISLEGVTRGAKLASQLLSFARRQPLDPTAMNVGDKVRAMHELLRRSIGGEIEIATTIDADLWNTFVDANHFENVLLNLAINARDAMKGKGQLTLEARNVLLDDDYAAFHPEVSAGEYVLIAVTDTGCGMSHEVVDKAFEPFFTTKPDGRGTGLGLSMVHGFVKQSGGHIKIYSEVGHGTALKVYLPRSHAEVVEAPLIVESDAPIGSETVLVVEDDPQVRDAVIATLTHLGYRVLAAHDGESALAIANSGVHIDVLFTDVVMPGNLPSPELARAAKCLLPHLAVLFTSGYSEDAIVHGGRLDAGVQLISKPYRYQELARKLRQVIDAELKFESASRISETTADQFRILFVEDDDNVRESSVTLLEILGHTVHAAASGDAAQGLLSLGGYDVFISDIELGAISGLDLAQQMAAQHPQTRIVLASGAGAAIDRLALPPQANVLTKPYTFEQLIAAIQPRARHEEPVSPG